MPLTTLQPVNRQDTSTRSGAAGINRMGRETSLEPNWQRGGATNGDATEASSAPGGGCGVVDPRSVPAMNLNRRTRTRNRDTLGHHLRNVAPLELMLAALLLNLSIIQPSQAAGFILTGTMTDSRYGHT